MKLSEILFESVDIEDRIKYETANGDPLPHHVSLTKFKPYSDPSILGKEYDLGVYGVVVDAVDKKVVAVGVNLPADVMINTGKPAHITVGLFEGGKPVNSGDLDFSKAVPLDLTVKVVLVNAPDNKTFAEDYVSDETKAKNPKGNAQLVLFEESSEMLKSAVQGVVKGTLYIKEGCTKRRDYGL